jgi:SAM-dependent methyltransferase
MEPAPGSQSFLTSGRSYDTFMGRYSHPLASLFADLVGLVGVDAANETSGPMVLDVGCGPGALTTVLVNRLRPDLVCAIDPSPPFVQQCATTHPGVDVRLGRAEDIPFANSTFDFALAQLVLHFVSEPSAAVSEMKRVVKPGGVVAASVWNFADGMEMLRHFWGAALTVVPDAPDEARTLRFGREGELSELLTHAGFTDVHETTLSVSSTYQNVDELWDGFMAGIGPAGAFCVLLPSTEQLRVRSELNRRLGHADQPFTLGATAQCGLARVP